MIRQMVLILLGAALLTAVAREAGAGDDPVPGLLEQIEKQDSMHAFNVLAGLAWESESAVLALAHLVREGREWWPGRAAIELAKAGHGELACELLSPRLSEGGADLKLQRARALFIVGREFEPAFDALAGALEAEDVETRRAAARVLCVVPSRVENRRAAFEAAARDEDWFVAVCCRSTLALGTDPALAEVATYVEDVRSPDREIRARAKKGLRALDAPPTAVGPALIFLSGLAGSSYDYGPPLRRIVARDADVARLLPTLINHGDARMRQWVLFLCTHAPAGTPGIEEAVLGRLDDRIWQIRSRAVQALPFVANDIDGAIERLLPLLDAPLEEERHRALTKLPVRDAALEALGSFGILARDAEAKIRPFLESESDRTRKIAAQALVDIGAEKHVDGAESRDLRGLSFEQLLTRLREPRLPYRERVAIGELLRGATPVGTPAELEMLFMDSLRDRRHSREIIPGILERMGRRAAPLVPLYIAKLDDRELAPRALRALTAIGPAAAGAMEALLSHSRLSRREVAAALANFGEAVVPRLMEIAGKAPYPNPWRQPETPPPEYVAIHALGLMGPAAAPAVPLLVERALKGDPLSVSVLGELGSTAAAAAPVLLYLAERGEELLFVRGASLRALARLGPAAKGTAFRLRCLLEQRTSESPSVARALGMVAASGDKRAIEALRAALAEDEPELRRAAAEALCRLGRVDEALPVLIEELDEPFAGHQIEVLKLIAELGPKARAAIPRLAELIQSEYTDVRESAWRALLAIHGEG